MRVRATRTGYYGIERKRPGDVFVLETIKGVVRSADGKPTPKVFTPKEQFSKEWMELVDESGKPFQDEAKVRPQLKSKEVSPSDDDVI